MKLILFAIALTFHYLCNMVNRNIILALAAVSLSAGASPRSVVSPLTTGILERATVMSARTNAA